MQNHICLRRYSLSCFFCFPIIACAQASSVWFCPLSAWIKRVLRYQEMEVNLLERRWKSFVRVCMKIFWWSICFVNPRPKPESQLGSLSHRGLSIKSPQIIHEYDLATMTEIQPLIQSRTCKMGSSILLTFVDSNLEVRPGPPLCSHQQQQQKWIKMFLLLVDMITLIVIILFFPLIQERFH